MDDSGDMARGPVTHHHSTTLSQLRDDTIRMPVIAEGSGPHERPSAPIEIDEAELDDADLDLESLRRTITTRMAMAPDREWPHSSTEGGTSIARSWSPIWIGISAAVTCAIGVTVWLVLV